MAVNDAIKPSLGEAAGQASQLYLFRAAFSSLQSANV
jgi:hypothetical protein